MEQLWSKREEVDLWLVDRRFNTHRTFLLAEVYFGRTLNLFVVTVCECEYTLSLNTR